VAYLDDILIATKTEQQKVLLCTQVTILALAISQKETEIPSNFFNDIKSFDNPSTIRENRRFLGFSTFICKYIPIFADKMAKFTDLLKENKKRLT
jgi:hypothetical protein